MEFRQQACTLSPPLRIKQVETNLETKERKLETPILFPGNWIWRASSEVLSVAPIVSNLPRAPNHSPLRDFTIKGLFHAYLFNLSTALNRSINQKSVNACQNLIA